MAVSLVTGPGEILQVSSRVQSLSLTGRLIHWANSNNSNTSFISSPVEVVDSNGEIGEMSACWWVVDGVV